MTATQSALTVRITGPTASTGWEIRIRWSRLHVAAAGTYRISA